jgi:SAM-dependent methyltransferase
VASIRKDTGQRDSDSTPAAFASASDLLADRLKQAWLSVEARSISAERASADQERWLEEYRDAWRAALLLDAETDLPASLRRELCAFTEESPDEVAQRCERAVRAVAEQWKVQVDPGSRESIERYYDGNRDYLYDLMEWHALRFDDSPLGYVTALDFALRRGCKSHLDFGSGVGAGTLLFARHGFTVALADISSTLLGFSRWRLERRGIDAEYYDLKAQKLPTDRFDMITAMDVFEHLTDPIAVIDELARALRPGGYLFGRFHADVDEDHPQHIVLDFAPTFARLDELGFREVWRDGWLWGHQVFQKSA